jgi:HSP20 family protein
MNERNRYLNPVTDICKDEGKVLIRLEMPGVEKNELDIQINGDELIISGRRKNESLEGTYLVRERILADYRKVFTIDETIDRDKVNAGLENGVLHLELNVKDAVKPKKIAIS